MYNSNTETIFLYLVQMQVGWVWSYSLPYLPVWPWAGNLTSLCKFCSSLKWDHDSAYLIGWLWECHVSLHVSLPVVKNFCATKETIVIPVLGLPRHVNFRSAFSAYWVFLTTREASGPDVNLFLMDTWTSRMTTFLQTQWLSMILFLKEDRSPLLSAHWHLHPPPGGTSLNLGLHFFKLFCVIFWPTFELDGILDSVYVWSVSADHKIISMYLSWGHLTCSHIF